MKKKGAYIGGLDGLRAIAVIMVVGYHLKLPIFKGGVLGVTVFFVLSGFLITRMLLNEISTTKRIDLKIFWIKRIRRIWPALVLMASCVIIVSAIFNRAAFTKASNDFISAIFGYNNWYQIFNNISYFDNSGAPSPLLHCWSVAIETQFYLIFPIILYLLTKLQGKNKRKIITIVISGLALLSSLLMLILYDPNIDPSRVYYGLDTRVFSLLIGALLAIFIYYYREIRLNKFTNNIIGIISLFVVCMMASSIAGYDGILYRGGYLLASIFTALVILSILRPNSLLSKILSFPLLDWLGKLSYSIYLWHYPVIILISGGKKSSPTIMIIELIVTLLLASLSYYFVETPIRYGAISKSFKALINKTLHKRLALKRQLCIIVFATLLFITSIGCVALVPKESSEPKVKAEVIKTPVLSEDDIAQSLKVMVIGDSITEGAQNQIKAVLPQANLNVAVSRHCSASVDIMNEENAKGWTYDCLVFSLGTNGPLYEYLEKTRELLNKDVPMFVLTLKAPYDEWSEDNNIKIRDYCKNTDNVYLIDWADYCKDHPDWFYKDETHVNPTTGANGLASCIKEAVVKVFQDKSKDTKTNKK